MGLTIFGFGIGYEEKLILVDSENPQNRLVSHYYPETLKYGASIGWKLGESNDQPISLLEYNNTKPIGLQVKLFFNDWGQQHTTQMSVQNSIYFIMSASRVESDTGTPITFRILWKKKKWVRNSDILWHLVKYDIEELMHDKSGDTVRANITLRFLGLDLNLVNKIKEIDAANADKTRRSLSGLQDKLRGL